MKNKDRKVVSDVLAIYDENTVLSYGKHKFKRLCNIPPQYLLDIVKNKGFFDKSLIVYILDNIEKISSNIEEFSPKERCAKAHFDNEGALQRLSEIYRIEQVEKKPFRAYFCEKCELWHLTSRNEIV